MERPKSIAVFGVLNVVFGALGLLSGLCLIVAQVFLAKIRVDANLQKTVFEQIENVPVLRIWTIINLGLGPVASAFLLAGGIGLLQAKPFGRRVSVGYGIYGILVAVVAMVIGTIYLWAPTLSKLDQLEGPMAVGMVLGSIIGPCEGLLRIVYCVLLIYFMTRPRVIAALEPGFAVTGSVAPAQAGLPPVDAVLTRTEPATPYAPPASSSHTNGISRSSGDETVATIIPYRNAPALVGYYLGLLSLTSCIPFVGIVGVGLAVAAFICGIRGLRFARQHPEVHGTVHAWIGIVGGGLCTIVGFIINVGVIIAIVASR